VQESVNLEGQNENWGWSSKKIWGKRNEHLNQNDKRENSGKIGFSKEGNSNGKALQKVRILIGGRKKNKEAPGPNV